MKALINRIRNEPVMVLTLLGGVITVVLQVITDAGADTNIMQAAVVAVVAYLARGRVTPTVKLNA